MSDELLQKESHSQSSKFSIFLKMFSFLIPVLDVIKLIIASVTSVILLAFACLTLGGSAVALLVSTPLFIIFSPVLVPATITTTLLATGLTAGATLGVTAIGLIMGLIRRAQGISLAQAGQSPFRKALSAGGRKRFSGGAGGGSRAQLIRKIYQFIKKYQGKSMAGGGGSQADFIKKFIDFLKKQQGKAAGGAEPAGGTEPPGGAEPPAGGAEPPAGEAEPPAGAEPAGGGAPTV